MSLDVQRAFFQPVNLFLMYQNWFDPEPGSVEKLGKTHRSQSCLTGTRRIVSLQVCAGSRSIKRTGALIHGDVKEMNISGCTSEPLEASNDTPVVAARPRTSHWCLVGKLGEATGARTRTWAEVNMRPPTCCKRTSVETKKTRHDYHLDQHDYSYRFCFGNNECW